jgi:hypothetical protein
MADRYNTTHNARYDVLEDRCDNINVVDHHRLRLAL